MAQVFEKRLDYAGNDLDLWEMAQVCGEMIQLFDKRLINWKMTQRFFKWPKYLGNGLDTWVTAQVFEKQLYYVANGLRI